MFIKSIKHSIDAQALLKELKNDLEHTKRFKSNRPKFYEGA